MITMEEFLQREAVTGHLRDRETGEVRFPRGNRTNWNELGTVLPHLMVVHRRQWIYHSYIRKIVNPFPKWFFQNCVIAIPQTTGPGSGQRMFQTLHQALQLDREEEEEEQSAKTNTTGAAQRPTPKHGNKDKTRINQKYTGNPTPVNASAVERLREVRAHRRHVCVYGQNYQSAKVVHFMGDMTEGARLLVHFYNFVFMEDYHHDLWLKRFVRDHLRYKDEIQCAAARVVQRMRTLARQHNNGGGSSSFGDETTKGVSDEFDSFHIRRGDFQYKLTRLSAEEILANSQDVLQANGTIFIATDERNRTFFDPFREAGYKVYFLSDFVEELLPTVNRNYYQRSIGTILV